MKNPLIVPIFTVSILSALISACVPHTAPVINKSPSRHIPQAYEVKPGDSIYTIAWSVGLDFLDIAEWNGLKKPYAIRPKQIIRLRKPASKTAAPKPASANVRKPAVAKTLPTTKPAAKPRANLSAAPTVGFSKVPGQWNWPAEGRLIGKYAPSDGSNGIQIAGADGSAIKATAAGEVVYVGEGLRGYGKLVIVKHSAEYLSAYAHNRDILVKEGQAVKSGQQIAKMGRSGTKTTMLHFEIRVDGKPVDPMTYLK